MMTVTELKRWLTTMEGESFIAIDDGELALVEVGANGKLLDGYLEIGGVPDTERQADLPS